MAVIYADDEQNEDEAARMFYAEEACIHDWVLRPEHDDYVCEMCGSER